ncbi:MAG: haloacid dehalogenase-like hydrolase [Bdellovibrionota bacterium]
MTASKSSWVVATDFDGTITRLDVGNEIHKSLKPDDFVALQGAYRRGELGLKDLQKGMWENFAMSEADFKKRARDFGTLRDGANDFLEYCVDQKIPVYVASCGIRTYIETVLDALLTPKARASILGIQCNNAVFSGDKLSQFIPPPSSPDSPYPLDKGAWIQDIRRDQHPDAKILGIGNGTSDRSFAGQVDRLAATEALARWCETQKIPFFAFESFQEILKAGLFR